MFLLVWLGDLMERKINVVALIAGVSTLVLIVVSIFAPWWQMTVGKPAVASVNVSPVNLNLNLLNNAFTIPIIYALNIATALTLAAGGIIMLIYAVKPNKSYSSQLLGFSYKKPLWAVVLFVVSMFVMSFLVERFSGFALPLMGSSSLSLPAGMASGDASVSVAVSAGFGWPFYFAILVAGLCIAARLYHRRITVDGALPSPPSMQ
jgi:hypothetical protein